MKINKNKIIILSSFLILFLFLFLLVVLINEKEIAEFITSKLKKDEPIKEISYEIYSNENDILKMIVTATDTENGISEVQLPNGNIIKSNNKSKVGIDYEIEIENNGEYTFKYISSTGEEITGTLVINDEFKNGLILGIEKVQEVSTEQDYRINKKYDGQRKYEYYYAIGENNTNWIKLSDKEIINVDMYKIIENNWQNGDKTTTLKVKKVNQYGDTVEVKKVIDDIQKIENVYNKEEQVIEGESIIACVRDNEIESGNYTLKVNGEEYQAEIYNYDENMNYITDKNLGTSEEDRRMLIIKYNGNLNIAENNLITAQTRKKGMFIYVAGELTNNGEISMTARGAEAEGQDVYLWKHENGEYEYVPAVGATGGAQTHGYSIYQKDSWHGYKTVEKAEDGKLGQNGVDRKTGGGASGYAKASGASYTFACTAHAYGGKGGNGTSYSGGNCGQNASASTNPGYVSRTVYGKEGSNLGGNGGGLLVIYADMFSNNGLISSKGLTGEYGNGTGGGSINIFYNHMTKEGTISAIGGSGKSNGGDGCITLQDINIKSPTITVDEITETSFRVNIEDPNVELDGVTYDIYINGVKKIQNTTLLSETIDNLDVNTNYTVQVVLNYDEFKIISNKINIKTTNEEEYFKYLIAEVYGSFGSDGASIGELEIYNSAGNKLTYTPSSTEHSCGGWYNNTAMWGYNNLYDGKYEYTSNQEGKNNCTYFSTAANNGSARFLITLSSSQKIGDIRVCVGDNENRTPKKVTLYGVNDYTSSTNSTNIQTTSNTGLTLLKSMTFTNAITTATWYYLQ